MINFPEQYKEICEQFILEYYSRRKWEIEQAFLGVTLPHPMPGEAKKMPDDSTIKVVFVHQSAFASQIAEIARAAADETKDDDEGWNRGVTYEGIQDLAERLFAAPGLGSAYDIPDYFWQTPFGGMVAKAYYWCASDQLITQTEAAELLGRSVQSINNYISNGKLTGYRNPDAKPHTPGGVLVSKKQVEKLL